MQSITTSRKRVSDAVRSWVNILSALILLSSAGFALGVTTSAGGFFQVAAASVALALGSTLFGSFTGLLFGMPREADRPDDAQPRARFAFNNNLLKVSDWVTTIIVGLTLVSLGRVPKAFDRFSDWVGPALGNRSGSGTFGVSIALFGFGAGLLLTYVWTLVALRGELEEGEREIHEAWKRQLAIEVGEGAEEGEIAKRLETVPPERLRELLELDAQRTAPLLRRLADAELNRREPAAQQTPTTPGQPEPPRG